MKGKYILELDEDSIQSIIDKHYLNEIFLERIKTVAEKNYASLKEVRDALNPFGLIGKECFETWQKDHRLALFTEWRPPISCNKITGTIESFEKLPLEITVKQGSEILHNEKITELPIELHNIAPVPFSANIGKIVYQE